MAEGAGVEMVLVVDCGVYCFYDELLSLGVRPAIAAYFGEAGESTG